MDELNVLPKLRQIGIGRRLEVVLFEGVNVSDSEDGREETNVDDGINHRRTGDSLVGILIDVNSTDAPFCFTIDNGTGNDSSRVSIYVTHVYAIYLLVRGQLPAPQKARYS